MTTLTILTLVSTFLTFVAFVFLLFAVIGDISNTPGITNIYYYRFDFQTQGGLIGDISNLAGEPDFMTLGLWSYCYGKYATGVQYCSPPKLGYEIDSTGVISSIVSQYLSKETSVIDSTMSKTILGLFIPSIVFTFLALFPGALAHRKRLPNLVASVLTTLGFVFTLVTFIAIMVVFSMVNGDMSGVTNDVKSSTGNATWLTLGAAIALMIASAGFFLGCCCCGLARRDQRTVADDEVANEEAVEK